VAAVVPVADKCTDTARGARWQNAREGALWCARAHARTRASWPNGGTTWRAARRPNVQVVTYAVKHACMPANSQGKSSLGEWPMMGGVENEQGRRGTDRFPKGAGKLIRSLPKQGQVRARAMVKLPAATAAATAQQSCDDAMCRCAPRYEFQTLSRDPLPTVRCARTDFWRLRHSSHLTPRQRVCYRWSGGPRREGHRVDCKLSNVASVSGGQCSTSGARLMPGNDPVPAL
jgi:hypothetical protein